MKTIGYQTQNGFVVNNVCTKISENVPVVRDGGSEATTAWTYLEPSTTRMTAKPRAAIQNPEDFIGSNEFESSNEEFSLSPGIFTGLNIETLNERRSTDPNSFKAHVEEKGILKTVKTKVVGWKNSTVRKWNEWFG